MERRALPAILLVVLVALTGCSGLFGGPEADATPSPTATGPNDPFASVSFPDGTSADGVENRTALLGSHQRTLSNADYEISYNLDFRRGENVLVQRAAGTKSSLEEGESYAIVSEPGRLAEAYRNETTFASREYRNNSTQYVYQPLNSSFAEEHARLTGVEAVDVVLRNGEFSADAVVTRRDGKTFVRYTLDEATVNESANVSLATGSLVVSEEGVVYGASLRVEGTVDGARYLVDVNYRIVNLGNVTVQKPDWVSTAAQRD